MLQPLVVGLGRSGAGLHLKALRRMAAAPDAPPLAGPPVACDPRPEAAVGLTGVTVARSLGEAADLVVPERTVVHVCTPPLARLPVLTELAARGFRRLLVEKPLAAGRAELDAIVALRRRHGLDIVVMSHWLTSRLTATVRELVRGAELGALRRITAVQHKPRFLRSLTTDGHPTAFDIEVPHSLGLVLDLAGPASVLEADWSDLHCGDAVRPRLGSARLVLAHRSGVRTSLRSDLTSPVQQRSVTLGFERGTATAHYPLSEHDDHAQLVVSGPSWNHQVFRDDALTDFLRRSYRDFAAGRTADDFALPCEVVRLLCAAKEHCEAAERAREAPGRPRGATGAGRRTAERRARGQRV